MKKRLFTNIGELLQVREKTTNPLAGEEMSEVPSIYNAWLLTEGDRISGYGKMDALPDVKDAENIDLSGRKVMPAWVDSHTHIVFAKSREEEFVMRLKGRSYEEIAASGGGILNSAKKLQKTSEDELYRSAEIRLKEVRALGTGAIEIKSGYGLTTESELKMLRVIKRLRENYPDMPIKSTFLGAHALPVEYKERREDFIRLIIDEMLPKVAEQGLAEYCDVFCERGFFTYDETDRILQAAANCDMKPKVHANELDYSGGVQVGVKNKAVSVDHLEFVGKEELEALNGSGTMPTLLPSTAFFLDIDYAPARKIIDYGLPVAVASDYNPGSTPSGRMPLVMSLACIKMKMTPAEALNAMTINGAFAMEIEDQCGSITKGKLANFIVLNKEVPSLDFLPYAFGTDWIDGVYVSGRKVG
ncbi:MAG: imidazolonepropionase [Saprospirales bacterium]|nr:MAG: imidazolonepropionase [Saprospirales bacterium]